MKKTIEKNSGIALMIGCSLLVVTMILHPAGGSVEVLIRRSSMIITSHAIALSAIPFCFLGYFGIFRRLGTESFLSLTGFSFAFFGLIAVLGAAATNGLALPIFVQHYEEASQDLITAIKPVLRYNTSLNHAFDYVYMAGICISTLCWSAAILLTNRFPKWLGWIGVLLSTSAVVMAAGGFLFTDLYGFRVFVFGYVAWTASVALILIFKPQSEN